MDGCSTVVLKCTGWDGMGWDGMADQNYYFVNSDQHALVTWCQEKGHHPQYQGHLTCSQYDIIDPVGI